jgi:hypothetical protein
MSKRYPGNFITGNPVALTQTSNNGVWDLKDQYQANTSGTWQEVDGVYEIPRSLRIRSSASTYLSRVPSTSSNRTTWTWSAWTKCSYTFTQLFGVTSGVGTGNTQEDNRLAIQLSTDGAFQFYEIASGSFTARKYSAAKFRDPSGWYHLMVSVDYTQSIADNRIKMYVNGIELTSFSDVNTPTQNLTSFMNGSGNNHTIGAQIKRYDNFYDGYLAEMNFIDGQQLDPSYFGYFDSITNIWLPKKYTGSYGTNGFYLPFTDTASVQTLGRNYTSNYVADNNNIAASSWTKNNSVTAAANAAVAPDGTTTASSLIENSISSNNWVSQATGFTTISGNVYTTSAFIKPVGRTWCLMQNDNFTNGGAGRPYAWFNLSGSGAVGTTNNTNASILPLANGWYRCTITTTVPSTNSGETFYVGIYPALSNGNLVNPGNGTTALYVWGVAANAGSSLNTLGNVPFNATSPINSTGGGDWTPSNISLTAGATYDSMVDSPTNVFTTATDIGGVVSGNYPTFNILDENTSGLGTPITNGGLTASGTTYAVSVYSASFLVPQSGKWYYETVYSSLTSAAIIGIRSYSTGSTDVQYYSNGTKGVGGTNTSYGATWTTGDVIGVAVDRDAGTVTFYKNNASQGAISIPTNSAEFNMAWNSVSPYGTASCSVNFGQRAFAYAPPAGFKSINTTNIQALGTSVVGKAAITPSKWMDVNLWGGTGAPINIVNSGFQPDLVWLKVRNISDSNGLFDSVRGAGARLQSNDTGVEANTPAVLSSFNSNGFSISGSDPQSNGAGNSYVGWQWKQSPTSGFNIVAYTGTGVARSISHNLGVAPSFMIVKTRTQASVDWPTFHVSTGNSGGNTLNESAAKVTTAGWWNNTSPTSSNFTVGTGAQTNGNGQSMIAYLWAEVPGFSKFGSYTGNGSTDGPFVYTGFRPKFILMKSATGAYNWYIEDATRSMINPMGSTLAPNITAAEDNAWGSGRRLDITSNGFKIRISSLETNGSGATFIYAAFAESPFALNNRAR